MNKTEKLQLIPKISYPYKIINSFFANFYQIYDYNKIKNAVLGINDYDNEYRPYYLFYLIAINLSEYKNYKELVPYFNLIFRLRLEDSVINLIDDSINNDNVLFRISSLFVNIRKYNIQQGYFIYLIMQLIINEHYKKNIILPCDINKCIDSTSNFSTFTYYLNSVILREVVNQNIGNLLNEIIESYTLNKNNFEQYKIKHIYIFGSIKEQEYHRESDIDIVVEFFESSYVEKNDAYSYICKYNKDKFNRNTDYHEYNDFIEYNSKIDLMKIF
jgi:predicted nucleotidyltransferase